MPYYPSYRCPDGHVYSYLDTTEYVNLCKISLDSAKRAADSICLITPACKAKLAYGHTIGVIASVVFVSCILALIFIMAYSLKRD